MSDHAKPDGMTEDYDGEICSEYKNVKLDDVPLDFFGLMLKLGWLEIKDIPKIALCNKCFNARVRTAMLQAVEKIEWVVFLTNGVCVYVCVKLFHLYSFNVKDRQNVMTLIANLNNCSNVKELE